MVFENVSFPVKQKYLYKMSRQISTTINDGWTETLRKLLLKILIIESTSV